MPPRDKSEYVTTEEQRQASIAWQKNNPERTKELAAQWREKNPNYHKQYYASKGAIRIKNSVYVIQNEHTMSIKVGKGNGAQRVMPLQLGNEHRLVVIHQWCVRDGHELERLLHTECASFWMRGEWFTAEALPIVVQLAENYQKLQQAETTHISLQEPVAT